MKWLNGASKSGRCPLTEANKKTELLQKWIYWLFEKFIIPLLRMHFYATGTFLVTSSLRGILHAHLPSPREWNLWASGILLQKAGVGFYIHYRYELPRHINRNPDCT